MTSFYAVSTNLVLSLATKSESNNEWSSTVCEVDHILLNPKYDASGTTWDNDMALIVLKKPVPDHIRPIHVADVDDHVKNCKSAGK